MPPSLRLTFSGNQQFGEHGASTFSLDIFPVLWMKRKTLLAARLYNKTTSYPIIFPLKMEVACSFEMVVPPTLPYCLTTQKNVF